MKFGIVTPLLNGRPTFAACAASVRAQRDANPELEVRHYVRESDASAPSCEDLARAQGCEYVRAADTGIYDAIGAGLDAAVDDGADVLAWINADEQLLPDALRLVAAAFAAAPPLELVFGDYLMLDARGRVCSARRELPARRFLLRNGVNYLLSCATFFSRRTWERLRPFPPDYKLLADKQFYLRAIDAGIVIRHIPAYLGAYGATGKNASLDPRAAGEQVRLRAETGVGERPLTRTAARMLRLSEKLFRGAYLPTTVETSLFDPDGHPRHFHGRVGTAWRWQ